MPGGKLDETVGCRHARVAVLVERFDDLRRAEEALLVDRDDLGDALGAVRRDLRDGGVGDRMVLGEPRQNFVVGRESDGDLV